MGGPPRLTGERAGVVNVGWVFARTRDGQRKSGRAMRGMLLDAAVRQRHGGDEFLRRLVPEAAELARQHGLDLVMAVGYDERALLYRGDTRYPLSAIDLTSEMIRLHDQRWP
jgi:hypothetical protein